MEFKEIINRAQVIQEAYKSLNARKGNKNWTASEYAQGLAGDVGDLLKLVMAKNNFRTSENIEQKLAHELSDCLWSIVIISRELGVDLEKGFMSNMDELEKRINQL